MDAWLAELALEEVREKWEAEDPLPGAGKQTCPQPATPPEDPIVRLGTHDIPSRAVDHRLDQRIARRGTVDHLCRSVCGCGKDQHGGCSQHQHAAGRKTAENESRVHPTNDLLATRPA